MDTIKPREKNFCSPSVKTKGTCFSSELLALIARTYNSTHEDKIPIGKSKKQLYRAIDDKLKNCSTESCWIEQSFIKTSSHYGLLEKSFRPVKPESWQRNEREWLNTYDILGVMKQYEDSDKQFKFMGVFPIDFAAKTKSGSCIAQQMCEMDLKKLWKQKIKKIGMVFNTDKHNESGSHWISLFIGLNPKGKNFGVFYYDSVAMKPQKEIQVFMQKIKKEIAKLHPASAESVQIQINKQRKQFKNTNCGLFSMLFIIFMMRQTFEFACSNMGNDDDVQEFRDLLYRP